MQVVSQNWGRSSVRFVTLVTSALVAQLFQDHAMTTVWIYVDTSKEVGDVDHLKVFATAELADEWFKENDPEGMAFGYEMIEE
jgi:hypothetical protein